jgi:phage gp36-like protein
MHGLDDVVTWVDRMAEGVVGIGFDEDADSEVGGEGAMSTSHCSEAIGMLKGLACHWQNMPYGFSLGM